MYSAPEVKLNVNTSVQQRMVKYTIVTSDNCQTIHKPAKMGFTSKKKQFTQVRFRPKSGAD